MRPPASEGSAGGNRPFTAEADLERVRVAFLGLRSQLLELAVGIATAKACNSHAEVKLAEANVSLEDSKITIDVGEYVMSEESGNMRRLWEACKTVSTDDIRAQARGSNLGGNETRGRMVVEDLFRRATEAGLTFQLRQGQARTQDGPKRSEEPQH